MIHEGDKVRSSGKYRDIHAKFGDTAHTVVAVGKIPSCKKPMIWLDCGGGGFMADGFDVVDAPKKGGVPNEQETRSDEARGRAHGRNRQARADGAAENGGADDGAHPVAGAPDRSQGAGAGGAA